MDKREQCKTITAFNFLELKKWRQLINIILVFVMLISISIAAPLTVHEDIVPYSGITVSSGHGAPYNIVIGPDNALYVSETAGGKIVKMNKNGQDQTTFASDLNEPMGMAFDSSGNMYVAEYSGKKVVKIDPSGKKSIVKADIGGALAGIAIDRSNNIFTVDYTNGIIYKMDLDGSNISTFVTELLGDSIRGMAIDSNDNLYVSDRSNSKIIKVAPDKTLTDFATGIASATWISLGKDGYFYAAAGSTRTIEKMDANGKKLRIFSVGEAYPWGLSVDADGYIYFADGGSVVRKIVGSASTASTTEVVLTLNYDISGTQADPAAFTFKGIASGPQVTNAVISESNVILTLDKGISNSDTSIKLSYTKTGTSNLCRIGGGIEFESFADLPVTNQILDIISVSNIPQQYVPYGTALGNVNLPGTVEIGLNIISTTTAGVVWDTGTPPYNGNTAGTYNFRGTINTDGNIANPSNLTASLDVVVGEALTKNIVSVSSIPDIAVQNGTQVGSLGLPSTVDVSLDDSSTTGAAVVWDGGTPAYNGSSAGTYIFTGTLDLDGRSDISNTGNLGASVSVTVLGRSAPTDNGVSNTRSEDSNTAPEPPKPAIPTEKQPNMPTMAKMNVSGTVKDGVISAAITEQMAKDAITAAQDAARKSGKTVDGIALDFIVTGNGDYTNLNATIDAGAIDRLKEAGVKFIKIDSDVLDITFDMGGIAEIEKQSSGTVTVSATKLTKLSAAAKMLIGNRPVFDITVGYQKNGKTEYVTNFGKGAVTLGIAYKAADKEKTGNLLGVYVDKKGKPQLLTNSSYDNGRLIFSRNSLSTYGVGYRAPAPAFTDTAKHWAKENIDFVAGRGLISEISTTKFAPDTAITRADFLMALGRLAGSDVSSYKKSSFTDVKNSDPAMPYIEWAVKNKIVQGIGNGEFGSTLSISRQDMAVMMQNYAKATSYKLPVFIAAATFSDNAMIVAYAKDAVTTIQQAGVIQGKGNNAFDPQGSATRAEASTILRRFVELVIDEGTARGWVQNDAGQWQYIDENGKAVIGWLTEENVRYYFTSEGIIVSGKWFQIDGKWYYFYANGSLAISTKVDGYDVDENGARKTK